MKKWIVMLAVLVMFCLAGCGEKPMTAVYFHPDDNSWYFADLDTDLSLIHISEPTRH